MTGKELLELRESAGMTQMDMAKVLNVAVTTISQWECGRIGMKHLVSDGIKARMARYLPQTCEEKR